MKTYEEIKRSVENMLDNKRFRHSLNVEKEAERLGTLYGADINKCRIAAIAHDCAKKYSDEQLILSAKKFSISIDSIQALFPQLLHGPVASMICKQEFEIDDVDILNAVYYHTTGRSNMSILEKIIYIADVIEESRTFQGIDQIRKKVFEDINSALVLSCSHTLKYIIDNNYLIHPLTIECRNNLIIEGEKNVKKE